MGLIPRQLGLLTLTAVILGPAYAEGGCPPGQMPYSATSAEGSAASIASCGPIPTRSRPMPVWENRWGAIADDSQGTFGVGENEKSEKKAEKAALADCKSRGGAQCSVTMRYMNQCAAIATSDVRTVSARAPDVEGAKKDSLDSCAKRSNGKECWVYYSGCSLPARGG